MINLLFIWWGGGRSLARSGFGCGRGICRVLQPPDLSGRTVTLLIACSDSENDGRFGRDVDVSGRQVCITDGTRGLSSTIDAHECQLIGIRCHCLLAATSCRRFDRQINRILCDFTRSKLWCFPWQVRPFGALLNRLFEWESIKKINKNTRPLLFWLLTALRDIRANRSWTPISRSTGRDHMRWRRPL